MDGPLHNFELHVFFFHLCSRIPPATYVCFRSFFSIVELWSSWSSDTYVSFRSSWAKVSLSYTLTNHTNHTNLISLNDSKQCTEGYILDWPYTASNADTFSDCQIIPLARGAFLGCLLPAPRPAGAGAKWRWFAAGVLYFKRCLSTGGVLFEPVGHHLWWSFWPK